MQASENFYTAWFLFTWCTVHSPSFKLGSTVSKKLDIRHQWICPPLYYILTDGVIATIVINPSRITCMNFMSENFISHNLKVKTSIYRRLIFCSLVCVSACVCALERCQIIRTFIETRMRRKKIHNMNNEICFFNLRKLIV